MSSEWRSTTLGEICQFAAGSGFTPDYQGCLSGEHPFIKVSDMNLPGNEVFIRSANNFVSDTQRQEMKAKLHPSSATVFAKIGVALTTNRRRLLTRPTIIDNNMMSASAIDREATPRFLYFLLTSLDFNTIAAGTALPYLNVSDLRRLSISIPSLDTQVKIELLLGVLDDRIALLRQTNATLEAIAQALFKSWFVDFDPVRAKQQGLSPAGMDEATAALFPDSFRESAMGLVPEGWSAGTLNDLAHLNSHSWSARNQPVRIRYLDLANVKANEINAVTEFAFEEAPSRARRELRSGDTIVGTVRPGNRSFAFIDRPVAYLTASTGFAVLSPKAVEVTAFVYLSATQDGSIEHLAHVADGGAYPAVRPDVVSALACAVPSAAVLCAFNAVACPLLEKVSANQGQAQTLATLRDTLLPRLISGRLRLPEAEALAATAA